MKSRIMLLAVAGATLFALVVPACKKSNPSNNQSALKLTSFAPQEEMEGAIVILTGDHFDTVKTKNKVTFNGVPAEVITASPTELRVKVPNATSGKITVTVGDQAATTATGFTVIPTVITATKLNAYIPCRVKFANSITGATYKWRNETKGVDLSTDKEPQVTFMEPGAQTISLTVKRADGIEIKRTLSLTIDRDANLVAYYPMDNNRDSSDITNSNFASALNIVNVAGWSGRANAASQFNGNTSLFQMPNGILKNTESAKAITVSLWFKPYSVDGKIKAGVLLAYQNENVMATAPGEFTPIIYIGEDERLYTGFWVTGGPKQIVAAAYNKTGWNHVVLTADAQGEAMYLNGTLVKNEPTFVPNHLNMIYNHLGKGHVTGWPGMSVVGQVSYYGAIDDFRIYKKKVDAAGATALFQDKW